MPRADLFISYSHKDRFWLEKIQRHLEVMLRSKGLVTRAWTDEEIGAGSDFEKDIEQAMEVATAALLLVSVDFLASDFIMNVELPYLVRKFDESGGRFPIMWIPVRPTDFSETPLKRFNSVVKDADKQFLSRLAEADVEQVILDASRKVCNRLLELRGMEIKSSIAEAEGAETRELSCLRRFDLPSAERRCFVLDSDKGLWTVTQEQATLFPSSMQGEIERHAMPRTAWKCFLKTPWSGGLVFSDWNGSVFQIDHAGKQSAIYEAHHDDGPSHLLACSQESGDLYAASWTGMLRRWSAKDRTISRLAFPKNETGLASHLIGLAIGGAVAVLERRRILQFDQAGEVQWSIELDGPVSRLWEVNDGSGRILIEIGTSSLGLIEKGRMVGRQEFEAPIMDLSMPARGTHLFRAVVATRAGRLEWLAFEPRFGTIRQDNVELRFSPHRIFKVEDPNRLKTPLVLGITADGELFSVEDNQVTFFRGTDLGSDPIRSIFLTQDSQNVYLVGEKSSFWARNPALKPLSCRVGNAKVFGNLQMNAYRSLEIRLTNVGQLPIGTIEGTLVSGNKDDLVEAAPFTRNESLFPGEEAIFKVSVKAKQHGRLPLDIEVVCTDANRNLSYRQTLRLDSGIEANEK